MGRRLGAAGQALAPCSPSKPTAQILQSSIPSVHFLLLILLSTAMERTCMGDCYYRATLFMARRSLAAGRDWARCSSSTPMARVLRTCIISLPLAETELLRLPDWFCRATRFMERGARAACLRSTRTGQVLRICTVSLAVWLG